MPYVPKFSTLFKILLRRRDPETAEGLFFQGTWLSEQGEHQDALMAFRHASLLDPEFAGAFYNVAALTERLQGPGAEALAAWEAYLRSAAKDKRQAQETIEKIRGHVAELKKRDIPD